MPVRLSVSNNWAPTGRIFINFIIEYFSEITYARRNLVSFCTEELQIANTYTYVFVYIMVQMQDMNIVLIVIIFNFLKSHESVQTMAKVCYIMYCPS
jgi:hypothetical protein